LTLCDRLATRRDSRGEERLPGSAGNNDHRPGVFRVAHRHVRFGGCDFDALGTGSARTRRALDPHETVAIEDEGGFLALGHGHFAFWPACAGRACNAPAWIRASSGMSCGGAYTRHWATRVAPRVGDHISFTLWVDNDRIAVTRRGSGRVDVRPEPRWVVHEPRPGRLNRCAASRRPIAKSFAKLALGRKLSLRTKEAITPSSKNAAALSQVSATRLPSRRCSSFDFFMADAPAFDLSVVPFGSRVPPGNRAW
jgi:hypothetical protein